MLNNNYYVDTILIIKKGIIMEFKVHPKEKIYFILCVSINLIFYLICIGLAVIISLSTFIFYALLLVGINLLLSMIFLGYLRGNAIKVNQHQFPELFEIAQKHSIKLGLSTPPSVYIIQGDGIINAFAVKYIGRNYVVLYSAVVAAAYEQGMPALEFIIGHELGHIKRGHTGIKSILLLPAKFIPALGNAYSRACEYTCDNIGYALCPQGAQKGILILAAGKELYKRVNVTELIDSFNQEQGFAVWYSEIFLTHPHLIKRLKALHILHPEKELAGEFIYTPDLNAANKQYQDYL